MLAEIVAPILSAWAIHISLWTPFAIGIACLVLCYGVLVVLPVSGKHGLSPEGNQNPSSLSATARTSADSIPSNIANDGGGISNYMPFFRNRNVLFVLPTFFVGTYRGVIIRMLLQYTSVRFDWKLSQVRNPYLGQAICPYAILNLLISASRLNLDKLPPQ